jgi:hypothetical protein
VNEEGMPLYLRCFAGRYLTWIYPKSSFAWKLGKIMGIAFIGSNGIVSAI